MIDAVDLDLVAGVLAEEDAVALLDRQRPQLPFFVRLAIADGDDLRLRRLLLGRVGNDDPALGLLFLSDTTDDHAILQRANFHLAPPQKWSGTRILRVPAGESTCKPFRVNGLRAEAGIQNPSLPTKHVLDN